MPSSRMHSGLVNTVSDKPNEDVKRLEPFQWKSFNCKAKYEIGCAGRRCGKSHLAGVKAVHTCTAKETKRVLIMGLSRDNVKKAFWDTLKGMIDHRWLTKPPMEGDLEIHFRQGSDILLRGGGASRLEAVENLRGISPSPNLIILDEFAFFGAGVFESVIAPMLTDPEANARVFIISSPNGARGEFYELYLRGQDPNYPLWHSWQISSAEARPKMRENVEEMRQWMDPDKFAQEFEAKFLNTGTGVFKQFNKSVNVRDDLEWFYEGESIHISIDFNVMIMATTCFALRDGKLHALWEFEGDKDTDALASRINQKFPGRTIICYPDPTGNSGKTSAMGKTDFTILEGYGFTVNAPKASPKIVDSVNAVNRSLLDANGNTRLFFCGRNCKQTIKSVQQTQWKRTRGTDAMDVATIDKSGGVEHFSDGIRYIVNWLFPVSTRGVTIIRGKGWF